MVKPQSLGFGFGLRAQHHQTILRQAEFLANDHALLKRYMGEVPFFTMAQRYSAAHPSTQPNARWFSQHLAEFLSKNDNYKDRYELISLAQLENAFNVSFDASDCPIFTMADKAAINPALLSEVIFQFSTSLQRFSFTDNVTSLWSALRAGESPAEPYRLAVAQETVVWRQAFAPRFRILGSEEAIAMDCALQGFSFGLICETIASLGEAATAAMRADSYLCGWLKAEMISSVRFATAEGAKS